jgi:SAM-dependent methyltransferase
MGRPVIDREDFDFTITDEAFAYLAIQKGGLDHLKGDRTAWEAAYKAQIFDTYETLVPFLPARCRSILDVGGGMGGIDALLNAHYGGGVKVSILDGVDDPPVMRRHAETFNHMGVAARFLRAHGVREFQPIWTGDLNTRLDGVGKFDLVVSFGAWCFHVAPRVYLPFVVRHIGLRTTLILEVRNDRTDWWLDLGAQLEQLGMAHRAAKFTRVAYGLR